MVNGKTQSGFNFKVDEKRMSDMRFLELLSKVDANPLFFPSMVETLLGAEQKEKLYDHVEKNGLVAAEDISAEIEDIFGVIKEQSKEGKNS